MLHRNYVLTQFWRTDWLSLTTLASICDYHSPHSFYFLIKNQREPLCLIIILFLVPADLKYAHKKRRTNLDDNSIFIQDPRHYGTSTSFF